MIPGGIEMILRRLTANLRAQNWTAITLEFLIVVIGVFIGTQVSNWNQERNERRETERMLEQFLPELQTQVEFFDAARTYSATNGSSSRLIRRARYSGSASIPKIGR
jgi:hypothetical protein